MAIRALFIGIDKHIDPDIPDLTGARRDATALWALFSDSLSGLQAQLLVDHEATLEGVSRALDAAFMDADGDDTVIVSFSGHGTHDHRLVVHNSVVQSLEETTVAMGDLAQRFRGTRAKVVFCILDCCFSGGAPARVLESSPIPRGGASLNPLQDLAGEGRILIAASKIDESAYEYPGTGHGLLTKALLEILQGPGQTVDLLSAMSDVMEHVRAEASRMGVSQTPVLLGDIKGGLILPSLKPAKRYFEHFPETRGQRVESGVENLVAVGLPAPVIEAWRERFSSLNELQLEAVNEKRILDGASLLVVAPTSSGKTFIGELAAARAVVEGRKAIFLLPYRALVNEKYEEFSALYGDKMGMRVVRCTGDYQDQTGPFIRGKYDLAILTYEMFLGLSVSNQQVLNQIGLVVIDEAQFLTDPQRGIVVELLITNLLAARARGIAPQIIALSAVIGGINHFDTWLGAETLVSDKRPVPLIEGVLDRNGTFQFVDPHSGETRTSQLLPGGAIYVRKEKASAQDVIIPLVSQLVKNDEKVIIFRNQRGAAQGCAGYLARELGLPPAQDALIGLPKHDLPTTSADLRACLDGGTAFHNTNLTREEKATVERSFRARTGGIRVLGATTTLAAGINTPASTVILAEQEFIGEEGRPFTTAEYKNMAGRAGRVGFNEEGKAIILADTAYEREFLFRRYVKGQVEEMRSSFDPDNLDTWVVRLLAQIPRIPRHGVITLLTNTYGGYLAVRGNPEWRQEMERRVEELLVRMISLGLVEQEAENIQLTLLGRACGRSTLQLTSALRLVELLKTIDRSELTAEKLVAIVQVLDESAGGYTPMMRKGQKEAGRPNEAAQRYGQNTVALLQRHAGDMIEYYARCKRAALLWDWIQGVSVGTIEDRYTATPFQGKIGHGDIRRFADATRFQLRAAHEILSIVIVDSPVIAEEVDALLKRLEMGLPSDALGLLRVPLAFSRGEYLELHASGIRSVEEVLKAPDKVLVGILGADRLSEIEKWRVRTELGKK